MLKRGLKRVLKRGLKRGLKRELKRVLKRELNRKLKRSNCKQAGNYESKQASTRKAFSRSHALEGLVYILLPKFYLSPMFDRAKRKIKFFLWTFKQDAVF